MDTPLRVRTKGSNYWIIVEPPVGVAWTMFSSNSTYDQLGTRERELWRITTPTVCAGLVIGCEGGRRVCIRAAPIMKQAVGKHLQELLNSCHEKRYQLEFVCLFAE